jgi:hypothetical protein
MDILVFASGTLIGFMSLAFMKAVIEPVATKVGKELLLKYASAVYDRLDKEWLPAHYQLGLDSMKDWLMEVCLPEIAEQQGSQLDPKQIAELTTFILDNFNIQKSLEKQQG